MNQLLEQILTSQQVENEKGEKIRLNSSIDREEIVFINELIKENKMTRSLEIGCAMGVSSLAICEAIKANDESKGHHFIVDPFQSTDWQSIGVGNLKKAGFNNFTHLEERSEFILPKLAKQGLEIDFAFIDGWHTFDHTLIDFFYLNRILKTGSIIVIDDVGMPAINKVMRFIHTMPAYEYIGSVKQTLTGQRKVLNVFRSCLRLIAKLTPYKISTEIFSGQVIKSDSALGLNSSMVAFRKIGEDDRPWNWHKPF